MISPEWIEALMKWKMEPMTVALQPITAQRIEELRADLQSRMPKDWMIRMICELDFEHHILIGYRLTASIGEMTEQLFIGADGQGTFPPGWTVERTGGSFYNEMLITAPNGQSVVIDDTLLA
jgi:hypothetical protein